MIATDDLLFIHLHKSGGTFVNQLLLRYGRNARWIGYHLPYRCAPPELRHLPVIGTLRDPFAYYVSWFHFQRALPQPNPLFSICSDGGRLGFDETVYNLVQLEADELRLEQLERAVPADFSAKGINLTKRCVRELRDCGHGFYSFMFIRMFEGASALHLLRCERIRIDLPQLLENLGIPVTAQIRDFVMRVPDLNTSSHGDPVSYFGEELSALVRLRDRAVIRTIEELPGKL